jgi:hypothetical protein
MFGLMESSYSRGMTSSGNRKFTGVEVGEVVLDNVPVFDVVHGGQVPDEAGHAVPVNYKFTMVTVQ